MLSRRAFVAGSLAWLGCGNAKTASARTIAQVVPAALSRDGAGVALRRALGNRALPMLDPFLLLDEIHSSDPADYRAGFPRHPHRGFETVSILLRGGFEHRDSVGNRGLISDGGAQWMTAGRGIVHEEMPVATGGAELWGLQLWVNLPAAHKMIAPRYQDLGAAAIPTATLGDARVRVIAGSAGGVRGPVDGIDIAPALLDVSIEPSHGTERGARFVHELPGGDTAFAYVLDGEIAIGGRGARAGELAVLSAGTSVTVEGGGRFLLVAGTPLREPIARRGPFVMTTDEELEQAFADYRSGRLAS
ncbi:MAG: pirin family protein [Deltaproteobacteria bacterium]|nr:pirin family protein [Deltaproteobacteria bacterium]